MVWPCTRSVVTKLRSLFVYVLVIRLCATGGESIGLQIIGSSAPSLIHTIFYNHTEPAASDNDNFDGMWCVLVC